MFKNISLILLIVTLGGCSQASHQAAPEPSASVAPTARATDVQKTAQALFKPLPKPELASTELVNLGRMLYHDPRLSKSGTISCNSCHALDRYGVDGQPTSPGHLGQRGDRNSPTVYNAALHLAQFWDGRSPDVEDQAMGPVLNPIEMAMPDADAVAAALGAVPEYREQLEKLFKDTENPVSLRNAAIAIAAFERGLITPSRFDRYLEGDVSALTLEEEAGLKTFVEVGCASCHMGATLGGNSYQKLGLKEPFPDDDPGRFAVTGKEGDKATFKVPALRNITKTGPYFHTGEVATLKESIELMGRHQLGKELNADEVARIMVFLETLTGELPQDYIAPPTLPATRDS